MSRERAVLFDVDGTLVDTNYLHVVSWWEAFRQAGHQVPMAEIHRSVGMGAHRLLDHLLGEDRDRDGDGELLAKHLALYGSYWSRLPSLEGARELLRACARSGLRVVLASSASEPELHALRRALNAEDAITAVTSSGDAEASKPAPDIVQVALGRAGVRPDAAVFVGDTVWDVQAGQRAGVPCIVFLTGGVSQAELLSAGAAEVYCGPAELLAAFDRSLLGALARS